MGYWLFKSEPGVFSWEMLKAKSGAGEEWTGIRNYQARNNMRMMKLGDKGFFYHSGDGKDVVGIAGECNFRMPAEFTLVELQKSFEIVFKRRNLILQGFRKGLRLFIYTLLN